MSTYTITEENLIQLDKYCDEILKKIGSRRLKPAYSDIWACPLCGGCLQRKHKKKYEFSCNKCGFIGNIVELSKVKKGFKPYPEDKSAYWDVAQELCADYGIDVKEYTPDNLSNNNNYKVSNSASDDREFTDPYGQHPAKEVWYNGIKFRSKLEAKWAVFFDVVKIPWKYETQKYYCFHYEDEGPIDYGADFYLPDYDVYVEVKGTDEQLNNSNDPNDPDNLNKIPAVRIVRAIDWGTTPFSKGLILLGDIPYSKGLFPIDYFYGSFLYHDEAVCLGRFHIVASADGKSCVLDLDKTPLIVNGHKFCIDAVDCVDNKLPEGTTVNLTVCESRNNETILDQGLLLARSARFDFMDSVEKMKREGRDVIGGK